MPSFYKRICTRMQSPRHIVITGASSGLGAALARAYAGPGIRLGLIARREALLHDLARTLALTGADVWVGTADICDRESIARILTEADDRMPVDLLIANAGISGGTFGAGESDEQARAIFSVNLDGTINTVQPLMRRMMSRGHGQIALMASLAGFRGLPSAPAYCASKAAVRLWGEGLRVELKPHGVQVNVICPGYVDTPMTKRNQFPMPFLMSPGRAATIMVRGLKNNAARIAYPFPMAFAVWLLSLLPPGWTDGALAYLPKKASLER